MLHEYRPSGPDRQLVEEVEVIAQGVVDGAVSGLAYVALLKGGRFAVNWAGSVSKRPALTLGALVHLTRKIDDLIHEREPDDTR